MLDTPRTQVLSHMVAEAPPLIKVREAVVGEKDEVRLYAVLLLSLGRVSQIRGNGLASLLGSFSATLVVSLLRATALLFIARGIALCLVPN